MTNNSLERENQCVNIIAVGDVCLGDHYFTVGHGVGSTCKARGLGYVLGAVADILKEGDMVFGNLECVLSDSSSQVDTMERSVFRGRPSFARGLREHGFNVMNIANNHILEHGETSAKNTIHALQRAGIEPVGLLDNLTDLSRPVFMTVRGSTIGFLGYSLIPERYCSINRVYAQGTIQDILHDVKLISKDVDITIVSVHCGDEGLEIASPIEVRNAREIIEAGANIYLGHHSHTFQGVERYKNGLIFHSLGNFVFDLLWDDAFARSNIVKITIEPKTKELKYLLSPVFLGQSRRVKPLIDGKHPVSTTGNDCHEVDYPHLGEETYFRQLRKRERLLQKKKLIYFMRNFLRGGSCIKGRFLIRKILSTLFSEEIRENLSN